MILHALRQLASGICILLALTACVGVKTDSSLETSGYLYDNEVRYRFKPFNSNSLLGVTGLTYYTDEDIYFKGDLVFVKIAPVGRGNFLAVFSLIDGKKVSVDFTGASYQIDGNDLQKIPFIHDASNEVDQEQRLSIQIGSEKVFGEFVGVSTEYWPLKKLEYGSEIRYLIPFSIADNRFLIDMTSRWRRSYSLEIYAPVVSFP